jgi:hypothetical protein
LEVCINFHPYKNEMSYIKQSTQPMESLLNERKDLETRLREVNRQIRSFKGFIDPTIQAQVRDILGDVGDKSCVGICELRKTLLTDYGSESVIIHITYDCAIGGCRFCQHQDSLFTRHELNIEFDVCCKEMLTISIQCDEEYHSDFEGGVYDLRIITPSGDYETSQVQDGSVKNIPTSLEHIFESNVTFPDDHIIIHDKLGPIHRLQYDIYHLWYDRWKKGAFDPRSVFESLLSIPIK